VRTVPIPTWVKEAVDCWLTAAGISTGQIFRAINKARQVATHGFSPKVIWGVVKAGSSKCGLDRVAPHDLRRYAECLIMPNGLIETAIVSWLAVDHSA
jgi:integrase